MGRGQSGSPGRGVERDLRVAASKETCGQGGRRGPETRAERWEPRDEEGEGFALSSLIPPPSSLLSHPFFAGASGLCVAESRVAI
jgi:hypothetical protein